MKTIIKTMVLAGSIGASALLAGTGGVAQANDEAVGSSEEAFVADRRGGAYRGGYSTGYVGGYSAGYGYRSVGGVGLW